MVKKKVKCRAILYDDKNGIKLCRFSKNDNDIYCDTHAYFHDYTENELEKITNGTMGICSNKDCKRWYEGKYKTCIKCRRKNRKYKKMKIAKKPKCPAIYYSKTKKKVVLCGKGINNSDKYCPNHKRYHKYTMEQLKRIENRTMKICSSCRVFFDGDNATCDNCLKRVNNSKNKQKTNICGALYCNEKNIISICDNKTITTKYCRYHTYFNDYTDAELEKIKNEEMHPCSKCKHWIEDDYKTCYNCRKPCPRAPKSKKKLCIGLIHDDVNGIVTCGKEVKDDTKYCKRHKYFSELNNDEIELMANGLCKKCTKCTKMAVDLDYKTCRWCRNAEKIKKNKNKKEKCEWYQNDGKPCGKSKIDDTYYCKNHNYVINYDDEMKKESKHCSGCHKLKYMNGDKTCNVCHKRPKNKQNKQDIPACLYCNKYEGKYHGYCKQHEKFYFKEQWEKKGKKVCSTFGRINCVYVVDNTKYSKCIECRKRRRKAEKKQEEKKRNKKPKDPNNQICRGCGNECIKSEFIGLRGQPTIRCSKCRAYDAIQDAKRKGRKRIDSRDPEVRKRWREKNRDKCTLYWMKHRRKKIKEMGLDAYRKYCAMIAKKYRDNNKDKFREIYKIENQNPKTKLKNYKYKAKIDGKKWKLTDENALKLMQNDCYFCDAIATKDNMNGIDRLLNNKDYIEDNCVSCCSMCNYIKCCLDPYTFVKRCEHILTYLDVIRGELHYELYEDEGDRSYNQYKKRAKKKDIEFELTKNEFYDIISNSCYICGRECSDSHCNGVDRFDNFIGYTNDNSRACCGECNNMKKDYDFYVFLNKLLQIYNKMEDVICYMDYKDDLITKCITKSNRTKLTKEQKCMNRVLGELVRNKHMEDTILNAGYHEQHAKELSERRKVKMENNKIIKRVGNINIIDDIKIEPKKITDNERIECANEIVKRRKKNSEYNRKWRKEKRAQLGDDEYKAKRAEAQRIRRARKRLLKPSKLKITSDEKREKDKLKKRIKRANETAEQTASRQEKDRVRHKLTYQKKTEREISAGEEKRLKNIHRNRYENETAEQRESRLEKKREYMRNRRGGNERKTKSLKNMTEKEKKIHKREQARIRMKRKRAKAKMNKQMVV